jgi:hypothetical protein
MQVAGITISDRRSVMDYVEVKAEHQPKAAQFGFIKGIPKYKLKECLPLAGTFPAAASFEMDPDFPKNTALTDVLYVEGNVLVVSGRVREVLEARHVSAIELLPVNVLDLQGKKVAEKYFLVNMLRAIDCIDRERSMFGLNELNQDKLVDVKKLVIAADKIDRDAQLFRVKGLERLMVARRDLTDALIAAKAKGLGVAELDAFTC